MLMNKRLWSAITNALAPQAALLTQADQFIRQAAVMVLITDEISPQLIFTLRAKHLTYHAGEVCFPGGMWEPGDATLLASALRETQEEIGLSPSAVNVLGALPVRLTRSGTVVTPFVARISHNCLFTPNLQELDAVFSVPLAQFATDLQIRMDSFKREGVSYRVPAYRYQDYEIWGFTAAVTVEFLALINSLPIID